MVDPVIWGSEGLVNTTTDSNQGVPSVTALDGGGYVVVWETESNPHVIQGQMYDAFGQKVGSELTIASNTYHQDTPAVAALAGGGFLVSWAGVQDDPNAKSQNAIQGIVYKPDGTPHGTSFVISGDVDPNAPGAQYAPVMTTLPNGHIAVAYTSDDPGGMKVVKLQMLDETGFPSGSEKIIAVDYDQSLYGLKIGSLGDGTFVLAWTADEDVGNSAAYMQLLDGNGDKIGGVVPVAYGDGNQAVGSIIGDGTGAVLVQYFDASDALGSFYSQGTQYFPSPIADVPPHLISDESKTGGQTDRGVLIAIPGGGYYSFWGEYGASTQHIVGRQLDSTGAPLGDEFHVYAVPMDVPSPYAYNLQASLLGDGRIVLTWQDNSAADGSGYGIHSLIVDPRNHIINGTPDDDVLVGSAEATPVSDLISGLEGNDKIYGLDGGDIIYAGGGADTIDGGTGNDNMYGSDGDDTYYVDNVQDVATEFAVDTGFDTVIASVSYTLNAGSHVEKLVVTEFDITGTGNEFDNTLHAGGSFDTLKGMGGNDTFTADSSNVTMMGGSGDDIYKIGSTNETVIEAAGEGTDTVILFAGTTYTLGSNVENLVMDDAGTATTGNGNKLNNKLVGEFLDNHLNGFDGNDTLDGGTGVDTLNGGKGDDTYVLGDEHDVVLDSAGTHDTITSTIGRKLTSYHGIEDLVLLGGGNANGIGNGVANRLYGNDGNNSLNGAGGNDLLRGGGGWDRFVGGSGKDKFDFDRVADIGLAKGARDIIRDFHHGQDKIDLSTIDASSAAGSQAFRFVAAEGKHFTGVKGQLVWDQQNHAGKAHDVTIVSGDIDGDKVADFTLELSGLVSLSKGDFVL